MSISIKLILILINLIDSQQIFECDFDYGNNCLEGFPLESFILLNETSQQPRQPTSDVTAISKKIFIYLFNY